MTIHPTLRDERSAAPDQVVLLDEDGSPAGTADRVGVHGRATPLHLAFSVHLTDEAGRALLTRRALTKATWPGVWTNSCCGHPRPGEAVEDAIPRRVREELGAEITDLRPVLPDFRYRAVDASGVVENEICPVYTATITSEVDPDPAEVCEIAWAAPQDVAAAVAAVPAVFSPWSAAQIPAMTAAPGSPYTTDARDSAGEASA